MIKSLSKLKKLQKQNMELAKKIVLKRDGHECMVKKHFPQIKINHSDVIQVDHCFSRAIKELFLDLANLTAICSACNQAKGSGKISASKKDAITVAVHSIVLNREGEDTYKRLLEIGGSLCYFPEWKSIVWQEEQNRVLKAILQEM